MRMVYLLIGVVVLGLVYVRAAPSDPARWHRPIAAREAGESLLSNSYLVVKSGISAEQFAKLIEVARATPRTVEFAGDVDLGLITFITRTRLMGYPDYTTIQLVGDVLSIKARARFGRGDGGVNRVRVVAWMSAANI